MPKTLFINSTPDIDSVWKKVHGPSDIPVKVNMGPVAADAIPKLIEGYDTVINDATYFNEDTLKRCTGLKHIVFLGTGAASFVDLAAAAKVGIKVSTISGYGDTTVAEHAMGLVFAAARHIGTMHALMQGGGWRPMQGMELRGKTLGVVGLGGIGREMARIASGIGLKVVAWNRSPRPDAHGADGGHRRAAEAVRHREPASRPQRPDKGLPRPCQAPEGEEGRHRRQHRARRRRRRAGPDRAAEVGPCRPLRDRRVCQGAGRSRTSRCSSSPMSR